MTVLRSDAFATPYRDPVHGGATDPILVEDTVRGGWLLLYTQRRAHLEGDGVEWVHGTRIGVARSLDGGSSWTYEGVVPGLEATSREGSERTFWAPDVVRVDDRWLMFLTVVDGVHADWSGDASIEQFESSDLETWHWRGRVPVASRRIIDASVAETDDGWYRLWFKDETRGSTTWSARTRTPRDPSSWQEDGEVIPGRKHEGPKAFRLGGWWWLIVDEWRGQAVYRSGDGVGGWQRQRAAGGLILTSAEPGAVPPAFGHHADVVPLDAEGGGRALVVYFTHPRRHEGGAAARQSLVRAAVLTVDDGVLVCSADGSRAPTAARTGRRPSGR